LKTSFPADIPEETRRIVAPLLSEDSVYRLIGQEADQIVSDLDFADMYAVEGRPGINPVVLALVTIFQFMEKLPDRAAAEMAVMRLDWKYALRQELDWAGFHYSDLCNFRKRLLEHGREGEVFESVVAHLRERGYIPKRGKQRTDSTHIVGAVAQLTRLELMWETLRMALGALLSTDAPWVLRHLSSDFIQRYTRRQTSYRLSKEEVPRQMKEAGQESEWLLGQIESQGGSDLLTLPEISQLRRVVDEQFEQGPEGKPTPRAPRSIPKDILNSPHDPEVGYGNKGSRQWQGYKLQVTETADENVNAHFVTDVVITSTRIKDYTSLAPVQERLLEREIAPGKQYVDQGYMSGKNIVHSRQRGIDLRGYVQDGNTTQPKGFRLRDFDIDFENRRAVCPAGKSSISWIKVSKPRSNAAYHVYFGIQCRSCPYFVSRVCARQRRGRQLTVNRYHDAIQARRCEAQTEAFHQEMHIRKAVEGTISEMVRAHGARRARYRGQAKNQLQAYFIATATNLKRLARVKNNLSPLIQLSGLRFARSSLTYNI